MAVDATDKIAVLNDALRANLPEPDLTFYVAGKGALTVPVNGGFLALTPLVQQVGVKNPSVLKTIFTKVREFSEFSEEIDPNGNREFGLIAYYDEEFFWKIDYYDRELEFGSDNPADPTVTCRVLTIMLAQEY